jgi:FtsH-binding integral membrane protein
MLRAETSFGTQSTARQTELVNVFMRRVYWWMTGGLGITAVVAFFVLSQPALLRMLFDFNEQGQAVGLSLLSWGLIIGELFLVFRLSGGIVKMQVNSAKALFIVYAILNGITLTTLLAFYTGESIFQAFMISAGVFGVTSIWASVTKSDLTKMRSFLMMGLIGVLFAILIYFMFASSMLFFMICVAAVILFTGLTAYFTQQFRAMALQAANEVTATKMSILGALSLYIAFVGLFRYILILFGNRE